jgi:uncharacterized protein YhaN
MRITGWHIDGFGVFTDTTVRNLPPDLTVVVGPNEAGKSTLLAFIRGVLFGFPERRNGERDYPPLHGGRHGGRVFVTDEEGLTAVVERHRGAPQARVSLADGSPGTEADLARLVGYADAEVFRNLFAFSLTELESLRTLDTSAVRDRIFTAAVVGAGRSARHAVTALDRRREALLRPRGSSATIPRLAEAMREADGRLIAARGRAAAYDRARAEEQHAVEELERLTTVLAERREAVRHATTLLNLWPDWSEGADARRQLSDIDVAGEIATDAEARLERLLGEVNAARTARDERREELTGLERRLAVEEPDDRLPPVADEVRRLYVEMSAHVGRAQQLAAGERSARELTAQLDEELARLGTDWDRARIAAVDLSFAAAEEIRTYEARMDRARARSREAAEEVSLAAARAAELAEEQRRLSGELRRFANVPTPEALDEADGAIRRLRASLTEHGLAVARAESAEQTLEDLRTSMPGASVPFLGLPSWLRPIIVLLAVALATGGVVAAGLDQLVAAAIAGGSALILVAVAIALRPRALTTASPRAASGRAQRQERLRAQETELDLRNKEVTRLASEVRTLANRLGLPELPTAMDVEERDALAHRQRAQRDEAERVSASLVKAGAASREAERKLTAIRQQAGDAEAELADAEAQWADWKSRHGIAAALGPRAALELMGSVERARSVSRQLEPVEREAEELRRMAADFEERAAAVLVRAGADPEAPYTDLIRAVTLLADRVNRDETIRRDRTLLTAERDTARGRLKAAEQRLATAEADLRAFQQSVGATDADEARRRILGARRREELADRAKAASERIAARIGTGQDAARLLAELSSGDVTGWRTRRAEAEAELVRLEQQREQAVRTQHDAANHVAAIEQAADVATAALEREGLRIELLDAVRDWKTLTLARALVNETLRRYERERQPAVMARASALFSAVTGGRYEQVVVAEDGLEVVDPAGLRFDTADLSRGTAEQLYLCIRFGLAAEFAAHAAPLPLVMDDVLVNFDPERARGMAVAIDSVANEHQVLLFTCHPNVVDLLVELRPSTRVIELARQDPTPPEDAVA